MLPTNLKYERERNVRKGLLQSLYELKPISTVREFVRSAVRRTFFLISMNFYEFSVEFVTFSCVEMYLFSNYFLHFEYMIESQRITLLLIYIDDLLYLDLF